MGGCLCKRKRSSSGRRLHSDISNSRNACNNAVQQVRRRLMLRTQAVTLETLTPPSQNISGNYIIED